MEETTTTTSTEDIQPCIWREIKNNSDWFFISCINRKVNLWKACKKRHITFVELFRNCPWCGKLIKMEKVEK